MDTSTVEAKEPARGAEVPGVEAAGLSNAPGRCLRLVDVAEEVKSWLGSDEILVNGHRPSLLSSGDNVEPQRLDRRRHVGAQDVDPAHL